MNNNNIGKDGEVNEGFDMEPSMVEKGQRNPNDPPMAPKLDYGPRENRRIMRNVIFISLAFLLLFTSFNGMSNLQASLYPGGLGNWSLSTIYASLVISSLFLPSTVIRKCSVKWTIPLSMIGYAVYVAVQFHPRFYTLIPASVLVGISASCLWSAKCTYLTHVGHQYAGMIKDNSDVVIVRFFGIFFLAFQSTQIWGNLISSTVLSAGGTEEQASDEVLAYCGYNFCPDSNITEASNKESVNETNKNILQAIYCVCSLLAIVVISTCVDSLARYGENEREGSTSKLSGMKLLLATFTHMKKPTQILMIPLTIWSGMEQGFLTSDYTNAYIACAWGIEKIGYVLICYGICDAIGSIAFGPIIRRAGRMPVFCLGAIINISLIFVFIFWKPHPDTPYLFFVFAGCWGVADAIWQTQINALYGVLFPQDEEPAFSNYRLWESIGFIIAYVNSNYTCISVKLYLLLTMIIIGMVGYIIVELKIRKEKKNRNN